MIGPKEIQEKEFSRQLRGYNEVEVDDFLDEIVATMQAKADEPTQVMNSITDDYSNPALVGNDTASSLASAQRLLDVAQRTADEIIERGNTDAATVMAKTRMECDTWQRDTTEECAQMKRDAEAQIALCKEELARLQATKTQAVDTLQRLNGYINDIVSKESSDG